MVMVILVVVALIGSAATQQSLPLSSFQYPSAPLLPIAPLVHYGDSLSRSAYVASPRVVRVQEVRRHYPVSTRNEVSLPAGPDYYDPCRPGSCGPNTRCSIGTKKNVAVCRCLDGFIPLGHTINGCREAGCSSHEECSLDQRCENRKCVAICKLNTCGFDADCKPNNRREALCECKPGHVGNAYIACREDDPPIAADEPYSPPAPPAPVTVAPVDPCSFNPCGANAVCKSTGNRAICSCLTRHEGDPLTGCYKQECLYHNDCKNPRYACHENKCVDPCTIRGICGTNADCVVKDRVPVCSCPPGYRGEPLTQCTRFDPATLCSPSPCGPNTDCRVENLTPICSCKQYHQGSPLSTEGCKAECYHDNECYTTRSNPRVCHKNRCASACVHLQCGEKAECAISNGEARCQCPKYYFGNPYSRCKLECTEHSECRTNEVCDTYKCVNPCVGNCGTLADCRVEGRKAICSCPKGYTGDPFISCRRFTLEDLCNPNPCGTNGKCTPGKDNQGNDRPVCTCPVGYIGDPLTRCDRGECESDDHCKRTEGCYNYKCQDVCYHNGKSVCGVDAQCNSPNHRPVCSCPTGYEGDPLKYCSRRRQPPVPHTRYIVGRTRRQYW